MSIFALSSPTYAPAMRGIFSITNAANALITTALETVPLVGGVLVPGNHGYISGTIVRLDIPPNFGMTQANQLFGTITVVSPTTFTITIDTTTFDPYVIPVVWPYSQQLGQCVPIGEDNSMLTAAVQNIL